MTLQADHIHFAIGRKAILHDLSLTAAPCALTAIVGPNGSGKTTLLRVLTGEERGEGRITLNGTEVTPANAPMLARMRGVLAQATVLAFPFTVIEVLRIGQSAGPYALRETLPFQALEAVGLSSFADRHYHELSGGEQQRVQLARVLCQVWEPVRDGVPNWLFLDEPVSSLDIGHQLMVMSLARAFAQSGGGVVAVMHDLNLTSLYADQVVLMQDGHIRARGTPPEVLTDHLLSAAYHCELRMSRVPPNGGPFLLPHAVGENEFA